jgi:hypothetical protein
MARNNQNNSNSNRSDNSENRRNRKEGGVATIAREQPARAAVIAAAAVGAGVFLWSRRNQISDQISNLSDQFGEWSQGSGSSGTSFDSDTAGLTTGDTASAGMSETGGGNASFGAGTGGGGGATSSATGRGQVRQSPTT